MSEHPREELRLALVMNGGVSLAVWMGGVSNEIFRLVTQQHPVYSMLLEMTRTTARVDVISGTSAGGVNGAAMSMALLYGGDFSLLRGVWAQTGSFGDLLRPPLDDNPGALLQGDEFFLPSMLQALKALAPARTAEFSPDEMPLDLRLTTTLLTGRQGHTVDDLGAPVHDVDYRAYFHFQHKSGGANDFTDRNTVIPKLARAARSTASFPFAFEPSYVTKDEAEGNLKDSQDRHLPLPRYVVDGGILDNRPFQGARQAIFQMPRLGSVRRVLAYINPDPGDGPPGRPGDEPSLAEVLSASLLGIPMSQTIADQLRAIEDHNEAVRTRRSSVLTLVESFNAKTLQDVAGQLYPVYRKRRLANTFELFVYAPLAAAVERHPALGSGLLAIGRHSRDQMQAAFMAIPWKRWIPLDWPTTAQHKDNQLTTWRWGLFPVEFSARVMLDLLRLTQDFVDYAQDARAGSAPHAPAAKAAATGDLARDWADPNTPPKDRAHGVDRTWSPEALKRTHRATAAATGAQAQLAAAWSAAYAIVNKLTNMRAHEQATWNDHTDALLAALNAASSVPAASQALMTQLRLKLFPKMFAFIGRQRRKQACADLAYEIATLIRGTCGLAAQVATAALASNRLRAHDAAAAKGLLELAKQLGAPAQGEQGSALDTLYTLMQLEVVEYAFNDHDALSSDTLIELVQISGNSASPLGGEAIAKKKLLGLQLAHFGAFYKQSWRANDWIYGRLDGAERLVKVLLNPERLHRFYFERRAAAVADIKNIALDSVTSPALKAELAKHWSDKAYAAAIDQELSFLDSRDVRLPDALPCCAEVVTLRLHYGILREELPHLLGAIHADQANGAELSRASMALMNDLPVPAAAAAVAPFSPEQARLRLQAGLIASEKIADEAGSDLFTRTMTHTMATLQSALASKSSRLGAITVLFAALKLPILGFHFVARGLTHQSRTSAALHGGILAVGAAIVLLQFLWSPQELGVKALPSTLVTLGWALLAYGLLMSVVRAPRTVGLLLLVAAACTAVYLSSPVGVAAAAIAIVLVASYWWPKLQWVAGFATVGFAAAWGSGLLGGASVDQVQTKVLVFASVVAAALGLAIWQASRFAKPLESRAREWLKKLTGGKKPTDTPK